MALKQKPDDPPPSKAYLVSFGDTMTALLAFFIVLLSLADDQTGMNLHTGTGSFVKALDGIGLPGAFRSETTARAIQRHDVSPLYLADDPENREPESNAMGPDEENDLRVIDREEELYQRFLNELERLNRVERLPETDGEVNFDLFNRLNSEAPYLMEVHREALIRVLPTLRQPMYRVDIIVWATMPSTAAWTRAAKQAAAIAKEVTRWARLSEPQQERLRTMAKSWRYQNAKRPVITIVVRKLSGAQMRPDLSQEIQK